MDVLFVAIALAFFALCVLYVHGCDNVVGRGAASPGVPSSESEVSQK